ncbi:MAG: hypothetical protein ACRC0V_07785 [Fusobacteriaceae bacterium]|uniref:hypothetical protein n=1 Tax=Romboutsia sp. TaxID=1965302 RepID=UPI003F412AE3
MSQVNSIRNENGIWINSQVFREEGLHYKKHGYYCPEVTESLAWKNYWTEQRNRCIHGYAVGGVKITGDHYFYLNFTEIPQAEDKTKKVTRKVISIPDFWDGDYNYFWVREIARKGIVTPLITDAKEIEKFYNLIGEDKNKELIRLFESLHLGLKIDPVDLEGGRNLIVGKSRRKGYSFKNGAVAAKNYYCLPYSTTILAAYEKKFLYPKGLYSMAKDHIGFINANTAWAMPSDVMDKNDGVRASYYEYVNGIKQEKGFKSSIITATCKDNPDVMRGKDAYDIFIEEAGAFGTPGLLTETYNAIQDTVKAGEIATGLITIFGTSGDMEGGTYDYSNMFRRPTLYNLLPFYNIWEEDKIQTKVGFFHPMSQNLEGYYDAQGNSDSEKATAFELEYREKLIKEGATSKQIQQRMQEKPLNPTEAFSFSSSSVFPIKELDGQLSKVISNNLQNTKGTPIRFEKIENETKIIPILNNKTQPITSFFNESQYSDKRGCPVVYEFPIANAPKGLYKIGYDPIRQDSGTSLAAIIVYKGVHIGSVYHSIIVAEYIGRHEDTEDIDRVAENFADAYKTTIMYENEVTNVKNYFRRIKRLSLLAAQPDAVISKNIKKSNVARVLGCHMNVQLKDAAEKYVKSWLLTVLDYDENGSPITVIDRIYSQRLLEELIAYNREGNFDLVSALFMCIFQVQEEVLGKEYETEEDKDSNLNQLIDIINSMSNK